MIAIESSPSSVGSPSVSIPIQSVSVSSPLMSVPGLSVRTGATRSDGDDS